MPINTKNSGSLVGSVADGGATRLVTFLKQTYVSSLGRNSAVGETQVVSDTDARFLIAYRYAKKADAEVIDQPAAAVPVIEAATEAKETEAVAEAATEAEETEAVVEGDEPERRFSGRRRRRD